MKHSLTSQEKAFVYKRDIACVASYISSLEVNSIADRVYAHNMLQMLSGQTLKLENELKEAGCQAKCKGSAQQAYMYAQLQILNKLRSNLSNALCL